MKKLKDVTFCFLDLETTGLHPEFGDRICETAMLKWKNGHSLDSFHSLVNPGRSISPGAYRVNAITNNMVKDAPRFGEISLSVLDFLKDHVIVAHNAPFDLGFLSKQLADLRLPIPKNFVLCTLILAKRCFRFPRNSLGFIAESLGLKTKERHRAMADVELTKGVFHSFLQHFQENGITSLEELLELQSGSIPFLPFEGIVLPPAIDEVIKTQKALKIKYVSSYGEETSRVIEPIEVVTSWDYIYLVAFCHLRKEKRTFRLDRILEIEPI